MRPSFRRKLLPASTLVALATFLFWFSLYVYVPFLPGHTESLGASAAMVGTVVAAYAVAQLVLRIPIGIWADSLGRRKPFVVAGLLFAALGALGLGLSPGPWFLFVSRAVTGVAAVAWVPAMVLYVSYHSAQKVPRAMGVIMGVNGSAQLTAALVGGLIARAWDAQTTFFVAAGVGIMAILVMVPIHEPPPIKSQRRAPRQILQVATRPLLLVACGIAILSHFVRFSTSFAFTPLYAADIGASDAIIGYIVAAMFAFATLGSLAYAGIGERIGYRHTIGFGSAALFGAVIATPFIHNVPMLMVCQAASGFGGGLQGAALAALALRGVDRSEQATAMGVFQALYAVGMLAGPAISGFISDGSGIDSVFYVSAGIALMSGVLAYVPLVPRR